VADYEDEGFDHEDDEGRADEGRDPDEPTEEELRAAEVDGPEVDEEDEEEEQKPPAADPRDVQLSNLNKALRDERRQRKEAVREQRALAQRQELAEQRQEQFLRRLAEANDIDISDLIGRPVEKAPTDPLEIITQEIHKAVAPLYQGFQEVAQQAAVAQVTEAVRTVESYHNQDVAAVEAELPDYAAAEDFMVEALAAETWQQVSKAYPHLDADDVAEIVEAQLHKSAAQLKIEFAKAGRSLARETYELALRRGYKPGKAPRRPAEEIEQRPRGRKTSSLAASLQRSPVTSAGASAAPRQGPLSAAALANMPIDEFEELMEKPGAWKRMVGK
jgi:hypothetical protein